MLLYLIAGSAFTSLAPNNAQQSQFSTGQLSVVHVPAPPPSPQPAPPSPSPPLLPQPAPQPGPHLPLGSGDPIPTNDVGGPYTDPSQPPAPMADRGLPTLFADNSRPLHANATSPFRTPSRSVALWPEPRGNLGCAERINPILVPAAWRATISSVATVLWPRATQKALRHLV
jgi:hypothetical protein